MNYLQELQKRLEQCESLPFQTLTKENTVVFIVDMIGGFAKKGALYSDRTEKLIPKIVDFTNRCNEKEIPLIAFSDTHPADSPEFEGYPVHCLEGSEESLVIPELSGYQLFPKNSTNAMFASGFMNWLLQNEDKQQFIITGVCSDICVYQFAVSLKCWFNQKNIKKDIIVPISMVDTFHLGLHQAELFNTLFLNSMMDNGIRVVKDVL